MNKYKIYSTAGILTIMGLFSLAYVNTGYLQTLSPIDATKLGKLCSKVKGNLKFCADSKQIIASAGNPIELAFTLENRSESETDISVGDYRWKYNFKITDNKGLPILPKAEQLLNDGQLSVEELIRHNTISRRSINLEPNQTLNEKIVISDIYDFTKAGTYFVEVTRITMHPTEDGFIELPLKDKIEIEVIQPKEY